MSGEISPLQLEEMSAEESFNNLKTAFLQDFSEEFIKSIFLQNECRANETILQLNEIKSERVRKEILNRTIEIILQEAEEQRKCRQTRVNPVVAKILEDYRKFK